MYWLFASYLLLAGDGACMTGHFILCICFTPDQKHFIDIYSLSPVFSTLFFCIGSLMASVCRCNLGPLLVIALN